MIVDSKGELPVAVPHISDEEDEGKPFGAAAVREQKAIRFSLNVRIKLFPSPFFTKKTSKTFFYI